MEYLPGGDLYQRLSDKGTLSLGEAVAWTAQAVLAIEDLHAKNIVHRDVKPGVDTFLVNRAPARYAYVSSKRGVLLGGDK